MGPLHLLKIHVGEARKILSPALTNRAALAMAGALCFFAPLHAGAQIGGKTGADSPVTLENVEDLNLTAGGVARDWVPDQVQGGGLSAIVLDTTAGLTLAAGQSPIGALQFKMPTRFGFVNFGFGVPTPSVAGASTLTNPGNLTSFTHLTFLVRSSINLADQQKEVILETYPGPTYPKIHWSYSISPGTTFQRVTIDLNQPSLVENAGALTVPQLLAQARFLYFYFYGGPEAPPKTLTIHMDDIQFVKITASASDWALY